MEDYIFVIRGTEDNEPSYGYMYLESEAKKFCESPLKEFTYVKIDALDDGANYEIKESKGDSVFTVFKEIGYGTFEDIGYTPYKEEAVEYLKEHSDGNMFIEEVHYISSIEYDSLARYIADMIEVCEEEDEEDD